jgi:hypothetical protein
MCVNNAKKRKKSKYLVESYQYVIAQASRYATIDLGKHAVQHRLGFNECAQTTLKNIKNQNI